MTVRGLLDRLRAAGCEVTVAGDKLRVRGAVPAELAAHLRRLHTGLRALLAGRHWWGIDRDGHATGTGPDGRLSFDDHLPRGTLRLAVGGDPPGTWDRIRPLAV